jgi:glutamyl-tRNA reductase
MSEHFKVFHLKSAGDKNLPLPHGYWHLATCLRSIVITEKEGDPAPLSDHEVMRSEEAYAFLLKVICGLDSPLLGETEVLGQFKDFIRSHQESFSPMLQQILGNLTRDAKKIRSEYLQNLGCTSYGSLLRKELKATQQALTLLGAGSLAQDIYPWFAKSSNEVQVFTRSPEKYAAEFKNQENLKLRSYAQLSEAPLGGVLVVAAPLSSQWIQENLDLNAYSTVYDLRGDSHEDRLPGDQVTTLQALFSSIERNKIQAARTKERAITAIKKQADHLILLERPRPFGWDDLCKYS